VEDTRGKSSSRRWCCSRTRGRMRRAAIVGQPEIVGPARSLAAAVWYARCSTSPRVERGAGAPAAGHQRHPVVLPSVRLRDGAGVGGGPRLYTAGLAAGVRQTSPPYRLRPPTDADAPFLAATSAHAGRRYLVTAPRDAAAWRYVVSGRSAGSAARNEVRIVASEAGEPVGYLEHPARVWAPACTCARSRSGPGGPGAPWPIPCWRTCARRAKRTRARRRRARPARLLAAGQRAPVRRGGPVLLVTPPVRVLPESARPPDLLRRLTLVLERRLADSPLVGYTGELRLSFFRDGCA